MRRFSKEELEALRASTLFDERYYLEQYPDVKMLGMDPLEHYLWVGKKLGRSASRKRSDVIYRTHDKERIIVLKSNDDAPPDLFSLRSTYTEKTRAVIACAADSVQVGKLVEVIAALDHELDIILAIPNSVPEPSMAIFDGLKPTLLTYPDSFGPAHAFLHIVNSGALATYESVLWIDGSQGGELPLRLLADQERGRLGLIASAYGTVPTTHGSFVSAAIGTFLARVGRNKPSALPNCPLGPITTVPSLILEQLRAYRIQVSELGTGNNARWVLSTLIAIIANEAGLKLGKFGDDGNYPSENNRPAKAIAFYLPQFHPIQENDRWWGKGFTEWTNVVKARPLFRSHYQPILPTDLGFYDLRTPETQEAQAELAKLFNVHGFCYYYYWFNGRKLLNQPIEQMLQSGRPDFPFCVCWANENWSRNWDGQNRHVLIEQSYSLESNRALIREFITMMKDPRYIRYKGKPVLLVYRIRIIPNWLETAEMWRDECRRAGVGEIHLCAVRFGLEPLDGPPSHFGVDSYVLFPPHESEKVDVKGKMLDLAKDFTGTIFDYDAVIDGDIGRFEVGYPWPVHRGAMLGWDNTARRPRDSRIFVGATPSRFHHWLQEIIRQEEEHNSNEESLIFINAWNEWAEGTALEPCTRFGRGYLHAVRSAVGGVASVTESTDEIDAKRQIRPAANDVKWYDGESAVLESAPTVLICAHVVSDRLFGGERSFLDVLDALSQLELNVVVAIPSANHADYINLISNRSTGVVVIPYQQWRDNREPDQKIVNSFRRVIRQKCVDLVYVNTIVLLEPLVAAERERCRTVVHSRELIDKDTALVEQIGIPSDEIIRRVIQSADFVIANSKATANLFDKGERTFCIPNVVDPKYLDIVNEPHHEIKFGIISSNIPKKGIADFIEIARRCDRVVPNARFIVIGPENSHIEELRTAVLPPNVSFAGYAQDPRAAMKMVNVVVSLSHFAESFGRTVAEAQAARRPVIAYDYGAVPELVEDGITGFLVEYRDVEAAAARVAQLCANRELIRSMGEAGRAKVEKSYAPATLTENLWRGLRNILGKSIAMRVNADTRTTIVVPVFNAYDETSACLASLAKYADFSHSRVLIIDDGSTDPRISGLLDDYGSREGFHLLTNKGNLGYTRTINIGIRWADEDDVLLLNSDTIVTPGFLSGLRRTAFSDNDVGTVTAMSDNAGAFSFPEYNRPNPKPATVSHEDHAAAILKRTAVCVPVEVPTGSGFCMYIRRALVNSIGMFDEIAFPRGYGEENDFCMRALKSGWRNLISPHAYVFHVRTASFGAEKEGLLKEAIRKVTSLHPDYASRVKSAFSSTQMQDLRAAAQG